MGATDKSLPLSSGALPQLLQGTGRLTGTAESAICHWDALFEAGCRGFDTAAVYGGGEAEAWLGWWMESRGIRRSLVVVTKGACPDQYGRPRLSEDAIAADLHGSLARLRTASVELYLLHRDDPMRPVSAIVEIMDRLQKKGLCGSWGVSNWQSTRVVEAVTYAEAHGYAPPKVSSSQLSLVVPCAPPWPGTLSLSGEASVADRAQLHARGVALLAWSALGAGFLSGRVFAIEPASGQSALDRQCLAVYGCDANLARLVRAREVARRRGATVAQIGLAYVLSISPKTAAVVDAGTAAHFSELLAAAAIELSAGDREYLESGRCQ